VKERKVRGEEGRKRNDKKKIEELRKRRDRR
jgi:hypothetical protein